MLKDVTVVFLRATGLLTVSNYTQKARSASNNSVDLRSPTVTAYLVTL